MADKVQISRLDNRNYQTWKIKMEMLLISVDLWHTVKEKKPAPVTEAWSKEDQKAKAMIILNVNDNQLPLVRDAISALDVWKKLKKFHEKATVTSRVSLLKKLCSLNYAEDADMEKHLFEIEELFDRLSCAGQKIESSLQVAMIYRSLPESYNGLVTALESRPDADQTLEFVKQRLMDEYLRRKERQVGKSDDRDDRALKVQRGGRQRARVCYYCRKPGHFRRDCPELQDRNESDAKMAAKNPRVCFGVGGYRKKKYWYVDSGCSNHMTSDRKFFVKIDESVKQEVSLADGSVIRSAGVGEGFLKCVDGNGKINEVKVQDVLYIPELDSSLLSVRKLVRKGLKVNFVESQCKIESNSGKVEAVAELRGELYALRVAENVKNGEEEEPQRNRGVGWRNPVVPSRGAVKSCCRAGGAGLRDEEENEEFYDCVN